MRRVAFSILLVLSVGAWDWLSSEEPNVKAGNDAYRGGSFGSALALYEQAEWTEKTHADVRFDIGAALYKLAQSEEDPAKKAELLDRAETAFRESLESKNRTLVSAAHHNVGNTMFLRERWQKAADSYKKALLINQDNDDARYNLELVLRRLKKEQAKTGAKQGRQDGGMPRKPGDGQQQKPQGSDGGNADPSDPGNNDNSPQSHGQGQQSQDTQPGQGGDRSDQAKPGQGQSQDPRTGDQKTPPQPGTGQPQNQPQPGAGQPRPSAPRPGDAGGQPNRDGADAANGEMSPGQGETASERDRKLDALENRSKDLRRRRLRRGTSSGRRGRFNNPKDW